MSHIHFYVELEGLNGKWHSLDSWTKLDDGLGWFVRPQDSYFFGQDKVVNTLLAGVDNTSKVKCIDSPRGLPLGLSEEVENIALKFVNVGRGFSFVTIEELLNYDWDSKITRPGFVPLGDFFKWRNGGKVGIPEGCKANIDKQEHYIINDDKLPEIYHPGIISSIKSQIGFDKPIFVKTKWKQPIKECVARFYHGTLPRINLQYKKGVQRNVRAVFWFS